MIVEYKNKDYQTNEDEKGIFVIDLEGNKVYLKNKRFAVKNRKGKTLFVVGENVIKVELKKLFEWVKSKVKKK